MDVQAYTKQDHYAALKDVMRAHSMSDSAADNTPATGVCVYERGELIAYAALRRVEGGMAILDGLITNPDAPSDMRDTALDLAVSSLLAAADSIGVKAVIAWSKCAHTLIRSEKHGFVRLPQSLIYRVYNQG